MRATDAFRLDTPAEENGCLILQGQTSAMTQGTSLCVGENQLCTVKRLCPLNERCQERAQTVWHVGPLHVEPFHRRLNKHQTRSTHLWGNDCRRGWLRHASQPAAGGSLFAYAVSLKVTEVPLLNFQPYPRPCGRRYAGSFLTCWYTRTSWQRTVMRIG